MRTQSTSGRFGRIWQFGIARRAASTVVRRLHDFRFGVVLCRGLLFFFALSSFLRERIVSRRKEAGEIPTRRIFL
jgi:hypothetical protein